MAKSRLQYSSPSRAATAAVRFSSSIGLGVIACRAGYRGRFYSAPVLATELAEAQENFQLSRLEHQINKADLLIIDDLSYVTFNRRHSATMFKQEWALFRM
ncbi:MAG: hypothetical protein PWP41_988 [Moorella sp. (in: firmicutes)]|nr:hypothetical protein [Moorella sp. (in: firmicutes)]